MLFGVDLPFPNARPSLMIAPSDSGDGGNTMSFTAKLLAPEGAPAIGGGWTAVGTFGGECFGAYCKARGANWLHRAYQRYYCERCAAEINELRARQGETAVCFERGW
jgi:hypothetical protein